MRENPPCLSTLSHPGGVHQHARKYYLPKLFHLSNGAGEPARMSLVHYLRRLESELASSGAGDWGFHARSCRVHVQACMFGAPLLYKENTFCSVGEDGVRAKCTHPALPRTGCHRLSWPWRVPLFGWLSFVGVRVGPGPRPGVLPTHCTLPYSCPSHLRVGS